MPKISVIMPVFEQHIFLKEAMESVLCQTFCDFEFLIVAEYNSGVEVIEIIEKYAAEDDRIALIYNEKKLGLSDSLNKGISMASGEFIARMDDDDISLPERFAKQIEVLMHNDDIGLCGTLQTTVRPESESILYCATEPEELKAEMLFGCQLSHTSIMFRRELFVENGWFYESSNLAEDYCLWLKILNKTKMINIGEALVKHRYGFNGISQKKGERLLRENVGAIKLYINRYLHIDSSQWREEMFYPWRSRFLSFNVRDGEKLLEENTKLLLQLERNNNECSFAEKNAFLNVLIKRFLWMFNTIGLKETPNTLEISPNEKEDFNTVISGMINEIWDTGKTDCVAALKQFWKIPPGSKIVIWGLGEAFKHYFEKYSAESFMRCYNLVAVCDNYTILNDNSLMQIVPNEISNLEFDYILISSLRYYKEIKNQLISEYKISSDKIGALVQTHFYMEDFTANLYE